MFVSFSVSLLCVNCNCKVHGQHLSMQFLCINVSLPLQGEYEEASRNISSDSVISVAIKGVVLTDVAKLYPFLQGEGGSTNIFS